MVGYDENHTWVNEAITDAQKIILTALGFPVPEPWAPAPWACGAFAADGLPIVIRHLPYLPTVNTILRTAGFRWNPERREWEGEDRTKEQVEVVQALHYCAGRYYADATAPPWAVACGTGVICPLRVGSCGA